MASTVIGITFHCKSRECSSSQSRSATLRRQRKNRVGYGRRKPTIKSMRAVVQRVASASVEVEGCTVSAIGPGLLVLVGLHEADNDSDAEYICRKVLNMRLFPNEKTGKNWDQSVMQRNYEVLLVSQFTLYGILKGNKPDFHVAMPPAAAKPFYASFVEKFQKAYKTDGIKGDLVSLPQHTHELIMASSHLSLNFFLLTLALIHEFKPRIRVTCCTDLLRSEHSIGGYIRGAVHYKFNVVDGIFGAMMKVNLVNDGPVTMQLDSSQSSKSANGVAEGSEGS